jgi:hypothetical protein
MAGSKSLRLNRNDSRFEQVGSRIALEGKFQLDQAAAGIASCLAKYAGYDSVNGIKVLVLRSKCK